MLSGRAEPRQVPVGGLGNAGNGGLHESFTRLAMRHHYDGGMRCPLLKPILLLLLAISLMTGLSQAVVASSTMVLQMTLIAASACMTGIDCDEERPDIPCDVAARCAAACAIPSIDMYRPSDVRFGIAGVGMGEAAKVAVRPGITTTLPPPPPRTA